MTPLTLFAYPIGVFAFVAFIAWLETFPGITEEK